MHKSKQAKYWILSIYANPTKSCLLLFFHSIKHKPLLNVQDKVFEYSAAPMNAGHASYEHSTRRRWLKPAPRTYQ